MKNFLTFSILFSLILSPCFSADIPSIQEKTAGMEKHSGYFNFYWDEQNGEIWLEIDKWNQEFLYVYSLSAGLGSNDIGLDRNQLGGTQVVKFMCVGPKVLIVQPNFSFQALSENLYEKKAVEESFAKSTLWGFQVEAEENGRVLVDLTDFLLRDAHGVKERLQRADQGDYRLDTSRSVVYMENSRNFPRNSEFEAMLTFTAPNPGWNVRRVSPDASSVTLHQHHSFIQLPEEGFEPRVWDPRSMYGSRDYLDFAAPIDKPLRKRFIRRHRLQKENPEAEVSKPVEPIVYYVDRGAPEPIRSALVEGASWWNQAFEEIGYKDAFQVKLMPEGADPMDVRYNVINWVHRSTRGWSYGGSITDPRTGEIIKGHVVLGSQRVRQDYLIASGLVTEYTGEKKDTKQAVEMALARIRQLSCHEVGHTLGVGHNYASSVNDRASVMDYPHPRIKIRPDGSLDLSEAYDTGIGEWDTVCVEYGYQDFPENVDEQKELKSILDRAFQRGLYYLTNQDASPQGGVHPLCNDWDNGVDPVEELIHKMKVRSIALNKFSKKKVRPGMALATLEEVLVPVYLFHRYQIEAAASVLGGLYYNHTVRDGVQEDPKMVPASEQRKALKELLKTLSPEALALPEKILNILPPRAPGYRQNRELFPGHTGIAFDALGPVEVAARMTVGSLLFHERAARMIQYHARNNELPGFSEVVDVLIEATWKSPRQQGLYGEIQRVVENVVLTNLMGLAGQERAAPQVRAVASLKLKELKDWISQRIKQVSDPSQKAHLNFALSQIRLYEKDPSRVEMTEPLPAPAGAPIGMY